MKQIKRTVILVALLAMALVPALGFAASPAEMLAAWKPKFDPSGAKYVMKVSNVSHPVLEGVGAGYRIRDRLWEETNGQIYFDYYPLSQLGGEVEVLNQLMMGSVQGMLCSSVAAANLGPKLGVVNLPFLVNSFDKLDKFVNDKEIFQPFLDGALDKGVMAVDITGYGNYGWATTSPVKTIADAKTLKFRIAEAPVNKSLYAAWGLNPVVMPWPDVPVALKQGVIDGLDHTPMVCNITKKFEVAKYFTQINYAQGLFIHLINKAWFDSLPADLQKTLVKVIQEECANTRELTRKQEDEQIAKAKEAGIQFFTLPEADMATLRQEGATVIKEWEKEIGADYLKKVEDALDYKAM
ncbi:MAG: C4-dicarboxylate ABC transporter substrate-binding protein [Deltaproteobacteria bacterium]|nr:MAG: C4-dicarboxylate ABC transporter substrate-binding protein [Deltaproteobacteria bacterium]